MAQMKLHEDFPDSEIIYFPLYDIDFSYMSAVRSPNVYAATGALNFTWDGRVDIAAFPVNMPRMKTAAGNICTNRNIWVESDGVYERENTDMTGVQVGVKPDDFDSMRWRYYSMSVHGDTVHRVYSPVTTTVNWSSSINYYRDDSTPENRMNRVFYAETGIGFSLNNGSYVSGDPVRYTGLCQYHRGVSTAATFVIPYYWHYNIGGTKTLWNFKSGTTSAQDAGNGTIGNAAWTTGTANLETVLNCINVFVRFEYNDIKYAGIMICKMSDDTETATPVSCYIRALPVEMWGDSITESNFPDYNSGTESEPDGGMNGTWNYSGDAVPEQPLTFLPNVLSVGSIIKCYAINSENMNHLAERLYNSESSLWTAWSNKLYSPSSALVALHYVPTVFSGSYDSSNLSRVSMAGLSLDTTGTYQAVNGYVQSDQWRESPEYTLSVSRIADNFSDYAPYTKMSLHVPFCGVVGIDPSTVTGGSISVKFRCDIITGNVSARIKCTDKFGVYTTLYGFGNCAYSIPIMGRQGGAMGGSFVTGTLGALGAIAALKAATNPAVIASATYAGYGSLAHVLLGSVSESATSASSVSPTGDSSPLLDLTLWLEISRSVPSNPANMQTLRGIPSNITAKLRDLVGSGICKVSDIHLNDLPATKDELAEIDRLLKEGVIL